MRPSRRVVTYCCNKELRIDMTSPGFTSHGRQTFTNQGAVLEIDMASKGCNKTLSSEQGKQELLCVEEW